VSNHKSTVKNIYETEEVKQTKPFWASGDNIGLGKDKISPIETKNSKDKGNELRKEVLESLGLDLKKKSQSTNP